MEFLKILWDNLKKGPVTDAFPFGETYTPDRLRGRVEIDPALCVGCGTCVHVCAARSHQHLEIRGRQRLRDHGVAQLLLPVRPVPPLLPDQGRHPHQRLAQRPPGHGKIYPDHPRQGQIRLLCRMRGQNARSAAGSAQPHLRQAFRSRRGRDLAPLPELPPHRRGGRGRPRLSYRPARKDGRREEVCLVPPRKAEKASADKENAKEAPAQAASAPKTAAPSREATAQPKSDPAASKAAPSAQTPPAEQAASAAAETRPYTPSGTESAAEKPSPAAGNTAD